MDQSLEVVLKGIDKAKGMDTIVFNFNQLNPSIDYVVITSASNLRQVTAISDYIVEGLRENNLPLKHVEGGRDSKWILVDADHVIVHVFEESERHVYALEKLYACCEVVKI